MLVAGLLALGCAGCSRGPQGDPRDAAPVHALIQRLDADLARLQTLFELREEVEQTAQQLQTARQELAEDFPSLAQDSAWNAKQVPPAAAARVRGFRASVAEYDRLVARHNKLAADLERYLSGRSPRDVHRLMAAMRQLRERLTDMLEDADYTKAVYVAQHAELVQSLGLQTTPP